MPRLNDRTPHHSAMPSASLTARDTSAIANQAMPARACATLDLAGLAQRQRALGDELRLTLLRVLRQSSYAVSELAEIMGMTQPALSHHLKLLHEAALVVRRREGNSIYYRRSALPQEHALTPLYRELDTLPLESQHRQRRDQVLARRRAQSQRFFDEHASAFREQQARISQADVYSGVVIEFAERLCRGHHGAMEIGPGDGELLNALAARFEHVIAIDHSERMLAQTAAAVTHSGNVTLRKQAFEALQADADQDLVVAAMVVHHLPDPGTFFSQAARVLRPGAVLIVAELCTHDQEWAQSACGDLWLGFEASDLIHWAEDAGFSIEASDFLAQRNGFRIQIHGFRSGTGGAHAPLATHLQTPSTP